MAALPGIEVLDVYDSPREWRCVSETFALGLLNTWRGGAIYRGTTLDVGPEQMICTRPGEALLATPHRGHAGSFHVIELTCSLLEEYAMTHQLRSARTELRDGAHSISKSLASKLRGLLTTLTPHASALAPQSAAVELSRTLVSEMMGGTLTSSTAHGAGASRAAARMRECLEHEGFQVDLDTLAAAAGLSKFHALRAFKRRYGLTPHAYQMCVRVRRVAHLLLAGTAPAEAAAACGFADQSHMNRHFKRILGVTPKQCLQAHGKVGELPFDVDRADSELH
ncbi:MAG TPA: AraC family transcriptional regulator [Polyangiaceae bacterium]|nr:AraC family transcriptional regulator [Polyangiaceae bacterium]